MEINARSPYFIGDAGGTPALQSSGARIEFVLLHYFDLMLKFMDFNFQPRDAESKQGWYSRGYLPHFDGGEAAQFVTFRLFDSMPQKLLEKWRLELPTETEFRRRVENYLDSGAGNSWLKQTEIAEIVQNSLLFHDGKTYRLAAWVIMPNHVHFLFAPNGNSDMSKILHSIKSFTAHAANKSLGRGGTFWQAESFDSYIRNREHFKNVIDYIEKNPIAARLCQKPEDWHFSSASQRENLK